MARDQQPTVAQQVLLDAGHVLFGALFRLQVEGRRHLPADGGVLVVCNHPTLLDPALISLALPRPAVHMSHAHTFAYEPVGYAMEVFDTLRLEPGAGMLTALRQAIGVLEEGRVLIVFPEGGVSPDGSLQPFQPGAARLAVEAGCPVVPAAVVGSEEAWPPGRAMPRFRPITVRLGPPLDPAVARRRTATRREAAEALTREMEHAVTALGR